MARPIYIFDKIKSKIRHLQSSPEKEKSRIVCALTIIVFALIIALWLAFSQDFKISAQSGSAVGRKSIQQKYPLSESFGKIIKEFRSNIENKINQIPVWKLEK